MKSPAEYHLPTMSSRFSSYLSRSLTRYDGAPVLNQ